MLSPQEEALEGKRQFWEAWEWAGRKLYGGTDDLWRCAVCGKWWVVPELARACEKKHADQGSGMSPLLLTG